MHVDIIEANQLDSARLEVWLHLYQTTETACFYHHPHWVTTVGKHLCDDKLSVAFLYDEEQLVLVMPLVDASKGNRKQHPAHDHLSLNDLLIHPSLSSGATNSDTTRLFDGIDLVLNSSSVRWWDWQITNVPERSAIVKLTNGLTHWNSQATRESASFDCTSESCPPHGKLRRNLRRLRTQFETDSTVRFEQITDENKLPAAFDVFLNTERSGWKGNQATSTAIADSAQLSDFYRALLSSDHDEIRPVINLLWRNDDCCAAQFGMQTDRTLNLLKIGYNEEFSRFSPGYLLLESVLDVAKTQNIDMVSLVTSPPWADRWHPDKETVWTLTHYNNNAFGNALRHFDKLKAAAKTRIKSAA